MKKKLLTTGFVFFVLLALTGIVVLVPNPFGDRIVSKAKARGLISYTAEEAMALAYDRCSNCHTDEKVLKYCSRCGPPFIVVTHFMRKYIDVARKQGIEIEQFTDAEIVAITQAWNGLIGNWESDWPKKDIRKLLDGDKALIKLLDTPAEKREIEVALKEMSAPGSYQRYGLGVEDGVESMDKANPCRGNLGKEKDLK